MTKPSILIGPTALFFFGCKEKMTPEGLIQFIHSEASGMRHEYVVNDEKLVIQYLPSIYWKAAQMLGKNLESQATDSFAMFRVYFSNQNESQSLSRHTSVNKGDYLDRLQYLDGDARYDFLFKQGSDTILPVLYHYERTYDLVPFDCINISFPYTVNKDAEFQLEYHDNMFSFGIIKWPVTSKELRKINSIELIKN